MKIKIALLGSTSTIGKTLQEIVRKDPKIAIVFFIKEY